jgi:hypothetical protein
MDHINVIRKPEERTSAANKGGCKNLREEVHQWATPRTKDADGWMMNKARLAAGKPEDTLTRQAAQWATLATHDSTTGTKVNSQFKSLVGDVEKITPLTHGKLNPRWVETLMGLPVGWTMPSCASPVTIERMNSDCLATVSSPQQQNEHSELF